MLCLDSWAATEARKAVDVVPLESVSAYKALDAALPRPCRPSILHNQTDNDNGTANVALTMS